MRIAVASLVSALISFLGSLAWIATREVVPGLLWLGISLVWLIIGIRQLRRPAGIEGFPIRRLTRRFSRLLLFWS